MELSVKREVRASRKKRITIEPKVYANFMDRTIKDTIYILILLIISLPSCSGFDGNNVQSLKYGMSPDVVSASLKWHGDLNLLLRNNNEIIRHVAYYTNGKYPTLHLLYRNESLSASILEGSLGNELSKLYEGHQLSFKNFPEEWNNKNINIPNILYVSGEKIAHLKIDMSENEVIKLLGRPDNMLKENNLNLWIYNRGCFIGCVYTCINFHNSRIESVLRIGGSEKISIQYYVKFRDDMYKELASYIK